MQIPIDGHSFAKDNLMYICLLQSTHVNITDEKNSHLFNSFTSYIKEYYLINSYFELYGF